jgi:ATP-dependent helicase/nuclease subunit A
MTERLPKDHRHRARIEREFDRNLLVEAGAGSGKTHSLARRMAAGIATGAYQIEHMAAVTFTRKAAAELRGRFQLALEERLTPHPDGVRLLDRRSLGEGRQADDSGGVRLQPDQEARVRAALGNLERFFAGTIHAFCAHLLRERPVESGIAPGFSELDEADDERMRKESWRDYITRAKAAGKPELLALLDAGIRASDLDAAFRTVCLYEEVDFPADDRERPDVAAAWQAARQFHAALQKLLPSPADSQSKCKVQEKAAEFDRNLRVAAPGDAAALVRALELWQGTSLKVTYKWWPGNNGRTAQALFDEFRQDVVLPFLTAWREYVYRLAVTVLLDARDHAAAERRRHNRLNYGDLLQRVACVLRENAEVRRALQQKYRWLFVDEFQDTDPVQAEIIILLAALEEKGVAQPFRAAPSIAAAIPDWRTVPLRPGALFVVGDPKQSIYRFRRADIDIYSQVKARILDSGGEVVPLTANFRSVEAVCGWANKVFETLFPAKATQHAPAFERLDAFREDDDAKRLGLRTLTIPETVAQPETSAHEADAVARYIRAEVDAKRRTFGSFLLLTRKKKPLATYARALEQYQIPVEVSGAGAFGASEEVHHLGVLLRALADPQDAISLVGVLRGPFFGLSDPELFEYVQAGGRLRLFDDAELAPGAGTAVRDALAVLRHMHRWTRILPAGAAVERILEHTGYLALAGTKRGGSEAGDLLHAIDRIRQVAERGGTLMDAVESLEEDIEASSEIDSLPLEPGRRDVVRLMNLHKAKGLQADVVFLVDPCGGYPNTPDVRVVRDADGSRGYFALTVRFGKGGGRTLAQPAGWDDHCEAEQQYCDAEEHRLLYVAATRARDLLVVGRWAKGGGRGVRAWAAYDPWLASAPELRVPASVKLPAENPVDLSEAALASSAAARATAMAAALAPSWSITSVTGEARHISKLARSADPAAADDATRVVAQDTPSHRADAGMAWGTLMHGLLEHAMRHASASRDDLRRLAMWLTVEQPQLRGVIEEAIDTVEIAAKAAFWAEAQRHRRSEEAPFAVAESARMTTGVIDLLYEGETGWQVIDYKTDRSLDDSRYAAQLEAYRAALRTVGCRVAGASVVSVRTEPA